MLFRNRKGLKLGVKAPFKITTKYILFQPNLMFWKIIVSHNYLDCDLHFLLFTMEYYQVTRECNEAGWLDHLLNIIGFQFMANKQFRMKKKILGTEMCTDISKHPLKNQYVQFLYEKNHQTFFFFFFFFIYKNILILY